MCGPNCEYFLIAFIQIALNDHLPKSAIFFYSCLSYFTCNSTGEGAAHFCLKMLIKENRLMGKTSERESEYQNPHSTVHTVWVIIYMLLLFIFVNYFIIFAALEFQLFFFFFLLSIVCTDMQPIRSISDSFLLHML